MSKHHSPGRWAAGTFAACLSVGMGIGANMAVNEQAHDETQLKQARIGVTAADGRIEEVQRNSHRLEQEIGGGCLTLIRPYLPGGLLNDTPEDGVITDLMSLEAKECGNNRPEVRLVFRSLTEARKAINAANEERVKAEDTVGTFEKEVEDSTIPENVLFGSFIGSLAGWFGGMITLFIVDEVNR